MSRFLDAIVSPDAQVRNTPVEELARGLDARELWDACLEIDAFRRESGNLYHRVRALFFLYAICRFFLPPVLRAAAPGLIPAGVHSHLLDRRFPEAIDELLAAAGLGIPDNALCSGLAQAFYQLGLQNLADQVRRSVRSVRGNQWMFRCGHPSTHPLRIHSHLKSRPDGMPFPILFEQTAVRMDLSHSAWSDIFFLGMDYPEGARVLNVSIDLALESGGDAPTPPVAGAFRVIDEPVIRLTSVDLGATADITDLGEMFHFAKDYLGLLKAAVIASGLIPIGMEGSGTRLSDLLARVLGPGLGFELVSTVNNIPKGSRLAVSTNLLGALIAVCMRATGQTSSLAGPLQESERRIVAARAILGEWLGGSGGGWQDSGGVWPGIKIICGCEAQEGDPEFGISRGRLLPEHLILGTGEVSLETRQKLQDSLVLVHGGMAQNVGPILEMVTEKYLLRSGREWAARAESMRMFDEILAALKAGDIRSLGALTTEHFFGPLQAIIPWATTLFTEKAIAAAEREFGEDFWGFWMLGGMSGGGMGFIFHPSRAAEARVRMQQILSSLKNELGHALPFAMEPVVYRFAINENGSTSKLLAGRNALMPPAYYPLMIPTLLRADPRSLPAARRIEAGLYGAMAAVDESLRRTIEPLVRNLLPQDDATVAGDSGSLDELLSQYGFDPEAHERIRSDLRAGLTGLSQNRLPASTLIEDVLPDEILSSVRDAGDRERAAGEAALAEGEVAIVSMAAGAGSRWTEGAGVVKALHPYCKLAGRHRSFVETHLAKSKLTGRMFGTPPAHIFTTSYLTHGPIDDSLKANGNFGYPGPLSLSFGRSIGLRLVPMVRDLRFSYEEIRHQILDERKQKMRESIQSALMNWAAAAGEGSDYRDNLPSQCLHPVGHWFEIPNLLLNGTLRDLIRERPRLRTLLLHNIDTVGVNPDPAILGLHRRNGAALTFEVIERRIDDRGGGLAKIGGRIRLVEGLALPREEDEYGLTYYNTLSTWVEVDRLLELFGLGRGDLDDLSKTAAAIRHFASRLPTYITLKDVKKRWGHGHEDVYPVSQFEKLWGDMTSLHDVSCAYIVVPRLRGQQLKAQAQLDGWLRDGSADYVEALGDWE
ncbi:MAG: UTP--glucose-1-phosphate uridylyltransferase [Verrucomicrobia bacterium]|nr:UTP--glucose-1-phosphate uridylyltransferase [Verrucomicrobiota bacterium]